MNLGLQEEAPGEARGAPDRSQARRNAPFAAGPAPVAPPVEPEDAEADVGLFHYVNLALKRRWFLVSALVLGLAAGAVASLLTTPIYRASATVQIDEEPAKVVAVESQRPATPAGADKFYQTQYELLKSRALAERVVAKENLAENDRFLGLKPKGEAEAAEPRSQADREARTARAVDLVARHLQVEPVRLSRIVRVSYESPDPAMSARIANAFASNYISWNLERRYEASSAARRFLEERLEQTRQTLEESQRRGNDYAQRNELITIEGGSSDGRRATGESLAATDLSTMNAQLAEATARRIQAEQRWRQAASTSNMALPEVLASAPIQALKASRDAAFAEYQQNLRLFKPDWPAMVDARKKIETLDQQIAAQVRSIRDVMRTELEVARRDEGQFRAEVERRKQELLAAQGKRVEQSFINTDINTSQTLYDGLLASYKEIGLAGAVTDNNIAVVDRARIPTEAIKPQLRNNLIQFGLAGLLLGALVVFLLDRFDLSLKAPGDIEQSLHLPVLGVIPMADKTVDAQAALSDPRSPLSEAYYSVRTALGFSTEGGAPRSLLISSSGPSEGKTTTSLALAIGFARLGKKVLLIDGDMRDPSLHKILGLDNGKGLSNLLAGGHETNAAVQNTPYENMMFLACGPLPPNPAELLGSARMRGMLLAAQTHFDMVIIDGPPVMGLADAPLLSNFAAGVVFVAAAGETRRDRAKVAIRRLRYANARLLGGVLTKLDQRRAGNAQSYGYEYSYGPESGAKRSRAKAKPFLAMFGAKRKAA